MHVHVHAVSACWRCSSVGFPTPPLPPSSFLTKIRQLELPQVADEQVLGLQVPVEDPPAMDVAQTPEQLEQKDLEG